MAMIMEPLKAAGEEGVEMRCADGGVRRIYPVLAAQILDWPELCTGACSQATRCPACIVSFRERGSWGIPAPLRTKAQTLQILMDSRRGPAGYHAQRKAFGLRLTWPYWAALPYANGGSAVVPDLLHQLHKGLFKTHLLTWWQKIIGNVTLDERYKGLPRYHDMRHYSAGLSVVHQWTGGEARVIEKSFLSVIASSTLHRAVYATRSIMDFIYCARLPQLDDDDLLMLDKDLQRFHNYKQVFVDYRAFTNRWGWNGVPKLHMAGHYAHQIRELGTPDGYDTEITERLHRHYVKNPWRQTSQSNTAAAEMVIRLQRKEAWAEVRAKLIRAGVIQDMKFRDREPDAGEAADEEFNGADDMRIEPAGATEIEDNVVCHKERHIHRLNPSLEIAQRPARSRVSGTEIMETHEAPDFINALHEYLSSIDSDLCFQVGENSKFAVWHRFKLHHKRVPFAPLIKPKVDTVRAHPANYDEGGDSCTQQSYFDCVLLVAGYWRKGINRYRAARVRVIFKLPFYLRRHCPEHLVYIELFDDFARGEAVSNLVTTTPSKRAGHQVAIVVPLRQVRMSCHLVPKYSTLPPGTFIAASTDLLDVAPRLYLNRFSSMAAISASRSCDHSPAFNSDDTPMVELTNEPSVDPTTTTTSTPTTSPTAESPTAPSNAILTLNAEPTLELSPGNSR